MPWPQGKEHYAATSPALRALAGATAPSRRLARAPVLSCPRAASPEHTEEEEIGEDLMVEKEGRRRGAMGEEKKEEGRGKKN
jgi:hypothetical protein